MGMTTPQDVCYLALPGSSPQEVACEDPAAIEVTADAPTAVAVSPEATADAGAGLSPILQTVMDMAAGEAQVLLVGDVGLATER